MTKLAECVLNIPRHLVKDPQTACFSDAFFIVFNGTKFNSGLAQCFLARETLPLHEGPQPAAASKDVSKNGTGNREKRIGYSLERGNGSSWIMLW